MKPSNVQILIIRLVLAVLFLHLGIDKINEGWLRDPEHLTSSLQSFHQNASGGQLTYLDKVAIPHAQLWSRLIAIGEASVGISLLLGLLARFSSLVGIFMVLNFHASTGNLFSVTKFFGSPWAALIIACFLVIFLAKGGRWAGADALLAKSNPNGILW